MGEYKYAIILLILPTKKPKSTSRPSWNNTILIDSLTNLFGIPPVPDKFTYSIDLYKQHKTLVAGKQPQIGMCNFFYLNCFVFRQKQLRKKLHTDFFKLEFICNSGASMIPSPSTWSGNYYYLSEASP